MRKFLLMNAKVFEVSAIIHRVLYQLTYSWCFLSYIMRRHGYQNELYTNPIPQADTHRINILEHYFTDIEDESFDYNSLQYVFHVMYKFFILNHHNLRKSFLSP